MMSGQSTKIPGPKAGKRMCNMSIKSPNLSLFNDMT